MHQAFWSHDSTGAGISVTWCHQCHQSHHCIGLIKLIEIRCNMTFLVIWFHWLQHQDHVMPMALSMVLLHSFCKGNPTEVQHNYFFHMMQLAPVLALWDADGIISGTIAFLRLMWSKWGATWLFGYCNSVVPVSVSHDTNGFINGTNIFLRSRQWK